MLFRSVFGFFVHAVHAHFQVTQGFLERLLEGAANGHDFAHAFHQLLEAQPNAAHHALARLADHYDVRIVTQNVDDLHERAGSRQVLHLHGELKKLRSSIDDDYVVDWTRDQTLADRDPNGYPMRPHIVWFGEAVPLIDLAAEWVSQADAVLVVGTSMQVYPAAGLLECAQPGARCYLVDPRPPAVAGVEVIAARAAEGVPPLVDRLIAEAEAG